MSKELIHLVSLLDETIDASKSQVLSCQKMASAIESGAIDMSREDLLLSGAILGWSLGSSGAYITLHLNQLLAWIEKTNIESDALRRAAQPLSSGPDDDLSLFIQSYIDKAKEQVEALERIKQEILSSDFDAKELEKIYSKEGRELLDSHFEDELRNLLED